MSTRIAFFTGLLGLLLPGAIHGGEIHVRADRDHLVQGESATITISVRGATARPVVIQPTVPYCQIEQIQEMQLKARAPQRGMAKSPAAGGQLSKAFDDLSRQIQSMPGELAKQGFGDAGLLQEYEGMLQGIRRQAQEALQGGNGPKEYESVYRVTP